MKILWKSYENREKNIFYTEHRGLRILVWWSVLGAPGTSWGRCGPSVETHRVKPIGQADTGRKQLTQSDSEWLSWPQSVLNLSINWSCRGVSCFHFGLWNKTSKTEDSAGREASRRCRWAVRSCTSELRTLAGAHWGDLRGGIQLHSNFAPLTGGSSRCGCCGCLFGLALWPGWVQSQS